MLRVGIFLQEGFETIEALTVLDYLRRAKIEVDLISTSNEEFVKSAQDAIIKSDVLFCDCKDFDKYDAFVVPGGMKGAETLSKDKKVLDLIKNQFDKGKKICAICAGPMVIINAGIVNGKKITGYPGMFENSDIYEYVDEKVVCDGNIITSQGPSLTVYFALKIIEELLGKESSYKISSDILLDKMER